MTNDDTPPRATTWLACGLEALMARLGAGRRPIPGQPDYDVVVVGSGYGGAVAAAGLAGCRRANEPAVSLCVLERGREYLPGAFPSSMAEVPGHVRYRAPEGEPQGKRDGLFDVRIGPDLNAVLANGLGGGSLINAGVMVRPDPDVIARIPGDVGELSRAYAAVETALGVTDAAGPNTIERHAGGKVPAKFKAHHGLATRMGVAHTFEAAPLSIAMREHANGANVKVAACRLCGDCATGCNHDAKNSLDTNLLAQAAAQGAHLYTGATVVRIERVGPMWCLLIAHTDPRWRAREPDLFHLYAGTIILAAGALGSTEILLRSRSSALEFSPMLGQRISGNGDMIAMRYDEGDCVHAVARESDPPDRSIGPTITALFRLPGIPGKARSMVQELAVPGPLHWLMAQMAATGRVLHELGKVDADRHAPNIPLADPCGLDDAALQRTSLLAVMNDDGAAGSAELIPGTDDRSADGALRIRWPELRAAPEFAHAAATLRKAPTAAGRPAMLLTDPAWRLLPDEMEFLMQSKRGPLTTVHLLGGCSMAAEAGQGVVDSHGQVFRMVPAADGSTRHPGLFVLDGAIVPQALGANPALTIAALAQRAVVWLRADRGWTAPQAKRSLTVRPKFRPPPVVAPTGAKVELIERMAGAIDMRDMHGRVAHCVAELTMRFAPTALDLPGSPAPSAEALPPDPMRRRLTIAPAADAGTLRLYDRGAWNAWDASGRAEDNRPAALVEATLTGHLDFMHREPSGSLRRVLRAGPAWLLNRGLRELWQVLAQRFAEGAIPDTELATARGRAGAVRRATIVWALLSHAGEVRRFDYTLRIAAVTACAPSFEAAQFIDHAITGSKRITYARNANPWKQLTSMAIGVFPARARRGAVLELDRGFLVRENAALMRILSQPDAVTALADLAALGMYLLRVLLSVHVLTFRKPDRQTLRTPQRLPGQLPGLPMPEVAEVEVARGAEGEPVRVRLTRYMNRKGGTGSVPVIAVHGFGASGTTFAHPAMRTCFAVELWKAGRDVWVVDLRTSAGMPAARRSWSFDEIAFADLPAAIGHVCRATGRDQVDVVAHCVGAAMLSMAVLSRPEPGAPFHADRELLPRRIRRLVLSQMGPVMVFSQANILRGYLMAYLRRFAPMNRYEFRVEGEPRLLDELLDRALSALPYPDEEFQRENPAWPCARTEFTGSRHRMDALYGRLFSLRNLEPEVLDKIDDFFGPVDLESLAQTIHFARLQGITTRAGRNVYVSRGLLRERWKFPTLALHGMENAVTDPATLHRLRSVLEPAGCAVRIEPLQGYGHQDCWIGSAAGHVCQRVIEFLDGPVPVAPPPARGRLIALPPWIGPVQGVRTAWRGAAADRLVIGAATDPVRDQALLAVFVPVAQSNGLYVPLAAGGNAPMQGMAVFGAAADCNGWMRFEPPLPPAGAAGTLMLLIYDDDDGIGALPAARMLADSALAAVDLAPLLHAGGAVMMVDVALRDWLRQAAPDVDAAVRAALQTLGPARLEQGLITLPPPDDRGGLALVLGSCQYPAGLLDAGPAFASYRKLAQVVGPEVLLLLGDQIYADATGGVFDPADRDDRYVRPYETLFANPHVRAVLRRLPSCMMLDDRELANNREGEAQDADFMTARQAYLSYQRQREPAYAEPPGIRLWFTFQIRAFHFFVMDTRTERTRRTVANHDSATILGASQMRSLLRWLNRTPRDALKFVAGPAMLVPRRLRASEGESSACLHSGGWDGYPASMDALLGFLVRRGIPNVVFLSGDEHMSSDATLTIKRGNASIQVRAIQSSPLYGPFPFTNSQAPDLCDTGDRFGPRLPCSARRTFHCEVTINATSIGNGYATVTAARTQNGWSVSASL